MGFGQRKQTMMLGSKTRPGVFGHPSHRQERRKVNSAFSFLGIECFGTLRPGGYVGASHCCRKVCSSDINHERYVSLLN